MAKNTQFFYNTVGLTGISANGTTGAAGHVLYSNGTNVYWANVATTMVAGLGLGSNSTAYFVNANTGIVANTTGTFVNAAYIATITSNNATYFNGFTWASPAAIGSTVANTGRFTTVTLTGGVNANGSIGAAGQVLTSNGSVAYWTTPTTGTVTSVASGNGLTGGPITATGTLSVVANSGIVANAAGVFVNANTGVVANTTGVYVNTAFIATLSANNTTYLNGQLASYYLNATNINAGTIGAAYLPQANATTNGAVMILDSVTNTSIAVYAASANSVKTAYDAAIAANTRATTAQTAATSAYSNAVAYAAANTYVNTTFAPKASPTFTGTLSAADVAIAGNLTVSGTTTYINTNNLNVGDAIVTLNADITAVTPPTENGGIEINRGSSANVQFIWDETNDRWTTNGQPLSITSLVAAGAATGITTLAAGNTTVTGFVNATTSVNSSLLSVGTSFIANTTAVVATGYVNVASDSASLRVGNSTVFTTVNSSVFSGTANNATNLGGVAASGYQTTAGLSANVATLTSNNSLYLGGTIASSYQLNSTLAANVATMTSNNSTYFNGFTWASPAAFGGTVANTAAFTTLSTSGTVGLNGTNLFIGPTSGGAADSTTYFNSTNYYNFLYFRSWAAGVSQVDASIVGYRGGGLILDGNNAVFLRANGNVIGTIAANGLTVTGNVVISGAIAANGTIGTAGQVLTSNGTTMYWSSAGVNTSAQYVWSNTHTFQNTVTFGGSTTVVANGYIGVGTNNPSFQLDVVSSSNSTIGSLRNYNANTGSNAAVAFQQQTTNVTGVMVTRQTDMFVGTTTPHPVAFFANNATTMYLAANGNVGVGTTTPSQRLSVSGNAQILSGGSAYLFVDNGSPTTKRAGVSFSQQNISQFEIGVDVSMSNTRNLYIYDAQAAGTRLFIDGAGNTGITTTSPKTRFQVSGVAVSTPSLGVANGTAYFTGTDPAYGLMIGTNSSTGDSWIQSQRTDGTATAYQILLNPAGGYTVAYGSMRSPIFYDQDNTSFYLDPAGTSQIGSTYVNGYFQIQYNPGSQYAGMAIRNNYANSSVLATSFIDFSNESGNQKSSIFGHHGADGSGYLNFLSTAPGVARTTDSRTTTAAAYYNQWSFLTSSGIATNILYDRDDTGWYVDPNNTSKMYIVTLGSPVNGGGGQWQIGATAWSGNAPAVTNTNASQGVLYTGGTGSQLFTLGSGPGNMSFQLDGSIFVGDTISYNPIGASGSTAGSIIAQGSISTQGNLYINGYLANLRAVIDTWHNSNEGQNRFYFANSGRSYYKSADGHEFRSSSDGNIGVVANDGNWYNYVSVRSPIFYDQDNTTYYINPNGTSRLAGELQITASANQMRLVEGSYGLIFRQDGSNFYLLSTNSSDQYGSWNSLRPLQIGLADGVLKNSHQIHAPIFYDIDDTSTYVNPNGTSWFKGHIYMWRSGSSNDTFGGIELRETDGVAGGQSAATYAPGINFHWSARAAARIYMDSGGSFVLGGQNDITNNRRTLFCNELYASGQVVAYYSDERLKTKLGNIGGAVGIIKQLNGFRYVNNELAKTFGYTSEDVQLGVSAQEVEKVLPELIKHAAFDVDNNDPEYGSKTGEHYKTVQYDRLVPVLIEAVKEQQLTIEDQAARIEKLEATVNSLIAKLEG